MNHEPDSRDAEPLPELPTLGARLRWVRQRAALNQAELAHQVGKRQQYISALEQDRIESPAPAVLAALATVLGVSPAWLMYGVAVPTVDRTGAEAVPPAAPLTTEESRLLQDYRSLTERDRALVRFLLQELRRLPPGSNPPPAPVSESARRRAPLGGAPYPGRPEGHPNGPSGAASAAAGTVTRHPPMRAEPKNKESREVERPTPAWKQATTKLKIPI